MTEATDERARFAVGDRVTKIGDYSAHGVVRAVFELEHGNVRYAVEHAAEVSGSYVHIYSVSNLIPRKT